MVLEGEKLGKREFHHRLQHLLKPTQQHGMTDAAMPNEAPFEAYALIYGQLLVAGRLNLFGLNQQKYRS